MIADKVYKGFVLPDLTTKQKVEEEKRARLQAEQRAERLAEQLRALGIEPDDI